MKRFIETRSRTVDDATRRGGIMTMTSFARIGSMKRYTMLPTALSLYVVVMGVRSEPSITI